MNRRRSVPAVAGLGVLLLAVTACGASASGDEHPDRRSFPLHGRVLTVDSDDSALEIVSGGSGDRVRVTRWFQASVLVGRDPHVRWAMKDDRLTLRVTCSGLVADCAARHRIEVPRGVAVKVADDDGSVTARGFRDALSVRTHDGSVRVTDSTGPLDLHTDDGSVRADVASRRVRTTTSDGSVRLRLRTVPDLVDARSSDGSVTVSLPHAPYRVSAHSDDGGVHVSVPRDPASAHEVTARTRDGKVTVRTAN
ncbi:DUF4097 family beta strand repeat-containing protein [Streptomyces sp. NPDC026672]|uniref:DUF4097 family beta strand repeat-containing protein n=1 Tax=unclassified Streptomyces TaxID=2593676 RepID=UPI0033DD6546